MKCSLKTFSEDGSSLILLPCQQISMSSSQMRIHAKNLLKSRVLAHSLLSIFFMRYVYELFVFPVILTAWTLTNE